MRLKFCMLVWFGITVFCSGVLSLSCMAQQRPQYTQYIFNNYLLNPAITGIENYVDLKVGSRLQWSSLSETPFTNYITLHMPLGDQYLFDNAVTFPGQGTDPRSRSYVPTYRAAAPHHGIGISGVWDRAGLITSRDLKVSYAYHLGLSPQLNMSVGVAAGIAKLSIDASGITLEDIADPGLSVNMIPKTQPDLSAGIWLYGATFFAGASVQQLLDRSAVIGSESGVVKGKQVPHLFVTGGNKFYLSDEVTLIPSIMLKYVKPVPTSVDLNVKVAFKDKLWLGASYRSNDAFALMAGFYVNSLFVLSYAYDFTTSEIGKVSNGSHEVVLGILLNNKYNVRCPQRNW